MTGVSAGERNFHVFYYLVAGATPDEREHLRLEESTSFRYLSHHRTSTSSNLADAVKFNQLKEAFKTVGFPKKAVASICQILSAILHLGNLDFVVDRSKNMDSAIVKNPHVLDIVAEFLGVDSPSLEATLVNKSMLVGGEMCGVFLDAEGAAANKDDLARALYGLVFSWIGEYLNEKLCRDDFSTFISVVDFAGPAQSSSSHREGYSIDAFCVNLASERLRAFALEQLFEADKADYVAENVASLLPSLDTRYNSNTECIRLLTNTPGGLVHIVDDQSRRKGKTDSTMLKAMSKRWGNHSSFGSRDGDDGLGRPGTFLCAHWDGPVTYSVDNFLSHNSSAVSPTFVSLLGGSAPSVGIDGRSTPGARDQLSTGGSSLSFVRQLFTSGAVETVVHPKSEETIVGASQKVGPRRAPSTRRPKGRATALAVTDTEDDEVATKGATTSGRSIVNEFNDSLFLLLATLADTKSWHVFCLRPNDAQLPNQVDAKLLKHQIRALGIAELAKRLQGEWSASVEHKELWDRYRAIPPIAEEGSTLAPLMYRDKALRCREILGWSEREMAVGRNKVRFLVACAEVPFANPGPIGRSSLAMRLSDSLRTSFASTMSTNSSVAKIVPDGRPAPSWRIPTLPTSSNDQRCRVTTATTPRRLLPLPFLSSTRTAARTVRSTTSTATSTTRRTLATTSSSMPTAATTTRSARSRRRTTGSRCSTRATCPRRTCGASRRRRSWRRLGIRRRVTGGSRLRGSLRGGSRARSFRGAEG